MSQIIKVPIESNVKDLMEKSAIVTAKLKEIQTLIQEMNEMTIIFDVKPAQFQPQAQD